MAADPRLDLTPYLYRTLEALQKEMSYAGRYRPIDPTDEPPVRGPEQLRGGSTGSSGSGGTGTPGSGPSGTYYPQAVPQAAPQGTTSYQSAPSVSVPQSQDSTAGNPWESAFNKVVNLLGSPVQSPFQGQPSVAPEAAPTQYTQPNWGTQASPSQAQTWEQSAPQTSQNKPDLLAQLFPNLLSQLLGGRGGPAGVESGEPNGDRELRNGSSGDSKPVRSKSRRNAR